MNKEYYKSLTDLLKGIILTLFVTFLGLIGYSYTSNDIVGIIAALLDFLTMVIVGSMYLFYLENLKD